MEIKIRETGEIEELSYRPWEYDPNSWDAKTGTHTRRISRVDSFADIASSDTDITEDDGVYTISQAGFNWWTDMLDTIDTYDTLVMDAKDAGVDEQAIEDCAAGISGFEHYDTAIDELRKLIAEQS